MTSANSKFIGRSLFERISWINMISYLKITCKKHQTSTKDSYIFTLIKSERGDREETLLALAGCGSFTSVIFCSEVNLHRRPHCEYRTYVNIGRGTFEVNVLTNSHRLKMSPSLKLSAVKLPNFFPLNHCNFNFHLYLAVAVTFY